MSQRLPLAVSDALARVLSPMGVAWCERHLGAFFDDYEFSALEFRFFADLFSNAASKPARDSAGLLVSIGHDNAMESNHES